MELRFVDEEDIDADKKVDVRYPVWRYRAKRAQLEIPEMDTVLRNARRESSAVPEN